MWLSLFMERFSSRIFDLKRKIKSHCSLTLTHLSTRNSIFFWITRWSSPMVTGVGAWRPRFNCFLSCILIIVELLVGWCDSLSRLKPQNSDILSPLTIVGLKLKDWWAAPVIRCESWDPWWNRENTSWSYYNISRTELYSTNFNRKWHLKP